MSKQDWRRHVLAARRALPAEVHAAEAAALAAAVEGWSGTVCAFCPVRSEPGRVSMLDALAAGAEVLLPVIPGQPGALCWARYRGSSRLHRGRFGMREPDGPVLAPSEVTRATTLLVPALAVDRHGTRLGRGAGYYDRTLALAQVSAIAVLRDEELVDSLPAEPHDVPVTATLTPRRGLVRL